MTIGEYLHNKTARNLKLGLAAWLLFVGSIVIFAKTGIRLLPLAAFIPFITLILAQLYYVRCPRCNGRLGQLMLQTLAPGPLKTTVICCPLCGTGFTERI